MTSRRAVTPALLLVALFAALTLWEMSGDSLTTDERWHLPIGLAYWKTREFRLSPEHPPLAKLLAAAPLLGMDLRLPPTTPPEGRTFHDYPARFGSAFFRLNPDVDRILFRSRLPIVALGVLLLASLFAWSRRLHGDAGAGLLTLALAALEPTLLAHAHYVTTDIALAAFLLPAFACLWAFSKSGRRRDLALAAVSMGLALASKFSALVLLPVFIALLVLRWPAGPGRAAGLGRRLAKAAAAIGVMAVIIQASYLFSPDLTLYLKGPAEVQAYKPPAYPAWVLGSFHVGNVWWYAPFAWLVKTPIPTILLIGVGVVAAFRTRVAGHAPPAGAARWRDLRDFVLLPAAVYAVAVAALTTNLGVRYLIPTTAFLLVAAGAAAQPLCATRPRRLIAVGLGAWLVLSVGWQAPEFIAYFNESIGARANAPYVLHDSNLDWGQDLKRLARWQEAHAVPELILGYWGGAQPEHYGVRWRPMTGDEARADRPPPGVYAISVNRLIDMKKSAVLNGDDPRVDWLSRFTPTERVGASIYIYRF